MALLRNRGTPIVLFAFFEIWLSLVMEVEDGLFMPLPRISYAASCPILSPT